MTSTTRSTGYRGASLLLALVSLLLAFAVAEMGVRLLAPQSIRPTFQMHDPRVKYRLRPNASWSIRGMTGEYRAEVRTNSLGWRSPELDQRSKIMVIGDSFTFGFGVGQEEHWPAVLEDRLIAAGRDYQVVNLATEGRSPDQYWADYHFDKARIDPALVIIGFFEGNDYIDGSPIIEQDGDRLGFVPAENTGGYRYLRAVLQGPAYDWLAQHSQAAVLAKNALYQLLGDPGRRLPHHAAVADQAGRRLRHPEPAALDFTARIMEGLVREVRADGVPVTVVAIPPPEEFYPATTELLEQLAGAGAQVEDLRPFFAEDPERFYFQRDDRHWNAAGHRHAAELIAAAILRSASLAPGEAAD